MNWLLIAYIIVYGGMSAAGVWSDLKSNYARWIVVVDALASIFGLTGLILFALSINLPDLLPAMQLGFPAFVFSSLFIGGIDISDEWRSAPIEDRKFTIIGAIVGFLFELPAFVICYLYAFAT